MSLEVRRYLIYDGDCGICSASARWARNWDRAERYRLLQPLRPECRVDRFGLIPRQQAHRNLRTTIDITARQELAALVVVHLAVVAFWVGSLPPLPTRSLRW